MRRKDREITDPKIIEEILNNSQVCRVALNDSEFPYIVPFNYGYRDNELYFHSAARGKKIDLIQKNNKVCFEIEFVSQLIKHEQSCKWSTIYRSIIGFGKIEIITDVKEKKRGLDIIMAHYGKTENNFYDEMNIEKIVVLRLTIHKLTGKQSGDWSHG